MSKKIDYDAMYTKRADGRYMGYWHDAKGSRHAIYDKDAKVLYDKILEKEAPHAVLFRDIAEAWHEEHKARVSYHSGEFYNASIKQLCNLWGDNPASAITPAMIQSLLVEMGKRHLSRRTVQARLNALNQIFDRAIIEPDIPITVNPCAAVRMPAGLSQKRRSLPTDKEIEIVKTSYNKTFGLFAYMALYTGLRREELLALVWNDVDLENLVIGVNKALIWNPNQPVIKETKTESGTRTVPILKPLENILKKRRGTGYIFGELSQTAFKHKWAQYKKETGLNITPHQLRHAFATMCYEADLDEKDLQGLLGHASVRTSRDIYTHIREQRRQITADKLNAYCASNSTDVVKDVVKTAEVTANANV